MLGIVAVILVLAWFLGFRVFQVAGGLVHLLLLLAGISMLLHLLRGRRALR